MTLTDNQQVRLKIQDFPALADVTLHGDGTANRFLLPQRNLTSASAYVPAGNTAWSATGATFDASGAVAFSSIISANSAFRLTYTHSTFSDDEVDHFLSEGGSVVGAAKEACVALMFDGQKRASWAAADGTKYDDTKALDSLRGLYATLKDEESDAAGAAASMESWSMNQGDY